MICGCWYSKILALCGFGLILMVNLGPIAVVADQCSDLKAQGDVDYKEVMGKWYIIETIDHKRPISTDGSGSMSSSSSYGNVPITLNMCPIVTLRFIDVREGPSRISLLWEDNTGQLEYTLWVPLNKNGTIWNADIQQNGSLSARPNYRQFKGTVHVTKAVASHMVLTFCERSQTGQKYSLLMGREHQMPRHEISGVHKLLLRRNLLLATIRESCANDASSLSPIFILMLLSVLLTSSTSLSSLRSSSPFTLIGKNRGLLGSVR